MSMSTPNHRDHELGAALRALETPEHDPRFDADLRRRLAEKRPSRRRNLAVAAVLAAAIAVPAAVLGVQALGSESAPRDWSAAVGDLPALASGAPKPQGAASTSLIAQVSREELVRDATSVFVGTVVAEGGSEFVDPVPDNPDFIRTTVHRVRLSVERTLRGDETEALDLTIPDGVLEADVFEVGDRLLVFASPLEFGELRVTGLTPIGFFQGVFRVGEDETARSDFSDVTFSLDELEAELQR